MIFDIIKIVFWTALIVLVFNLVSGCVTINVRIDQTRSISNVLPPEPQETETEAI